VIPPAWCDVRVSPRTNAKLQATGIDSAGRRQYLHHPDFRAAQEQIEFDKLIHFAERLPELRTAMSEHMEADSLERERIAAIAVRLVTSAGSVSAPSATRRRTRTFGITMLGKQHMAVRGNRSPSAIAARVAHAYARRLWTLSWPTHRRDRSRNEPHRGRRHAHRW
jgi:DNA topoisomerase IB